MSAGRLPLVLFPDGTRLEGPEEYTELVSGRTEGVSRERYLASARWRAELSARAGLPTTPSNEIYDVVIVGAGPAGPGLFIAGDVRHGSIKRVASAVGEGAMSIALVHSYLAALDGDRQ
ncbi:MAG: hypothetical protein ABW135_02070 [Thermoleophilaceae bacterium]